MTVVVTGAAGFVGRHLVAALAAAGWSVTGIDRRGGVPLTASAAVTADLADLGNGHVDDVLRSAEVVFHLAGCPGVRRSGAGVEAERSRDNVEATRRVTETVPLAVPLVVASSSSVYGGAAGGPSHETDTLRPRGGYARSKVEVERLCARRVSRGGRVAVARPFTIAGEGQRPDMALSRWLADARAGRPLRLYGSPLRTRDITDVRDVVEGLRRMADRGIRATVNLGSGQPQTLASLAAAVCDVVGVPLRWRWSPARADEPPATWADPARCRDLLGFVPVTDVHALVRRQAAADPATCAAGAIASDSATPASLVVAGAAGA